VTSKKQLKVRVRTRMTKTGESYTAARRNVVGFSSPGPVLDHGYLLRGGLSPDAANLANVMAHHRISADGQSIDEAIVFGVGGGPGAGYILWEFTGHDPTLVLAFGNQWQYPDAWTQKTLDRLGVGYAHHQTSGAIGAARRLTEELSQGHPCIVRPDRFHIGYWHWPAEMSGYGGHDVVVYAQDGEMVHVDDRNVSPLLVRRSDLDAARARVGSYKNSLYTIDPAPGDIGLDRLRTAVGDGIKDCVAHLSAASDSFSLPAWHKWARLMTDSRHAKAWPRVFADGRGLVGALVSIWECALPTGRTGGHERNLYPDVLDRAAVLLEQEELRASAEDFRRVGAQWDALAEAAVAFAEFEQIKALTASVRAAVADPAASSWDEIQRTADELWQLRRRLNADCPLDHTARGRLFGELGEALEEIYTAETNAVARLAKVTLPT
jgi:hypothetical protein